MAAGGERVLPVIKSRPTRTSHLDRTAETQTARIMAEKPESGRLVRFWRRFDGSDVLMVFFHSSQRYTCASSKTIPSGDPLGFSNAPRATPRSGERRVGKECR